VARDARRFVSDQFLIHFNPCYIGIIKVKPRVSRSSMLVSMATGFPIAKIASGYLLDELNNDITRETPARPVREFAVLCWKS